LEEAPNANNTNIRFFYVPHTTSDYPQDDVYAKWVVCSPDEMKKFSAIGYFFAKQLSAVMNFPMGMISSNWGGTPAETWTPAEVIMADSVLREIAIKRAPTEWWATDPAKAYNAMIWPITKYNIGVVVPGRIKCCFIINLSIIVHKNDWCLEKSLGL
jgi:sialate O-acetylesterase